MNISSLRYGLFISMVLGINGFAAEPAATASTATTASFKELTDYALSYKEAAEAGNPEAQYNLGAAYRWGVGVAQNLDQAVIWIRRAAENKYAPAQRTLATFYEKGEGVPQSDEEALGWYKKAAAQGDTESQTAMEALKTKMK